MYKSHMTCGRGGSHSNMLPPSEGFGGQLSVVSGWSQDAGFKMTHLHLGINDISGVGLKVGGGEVGDGGETGEQRLLSVNLALV